MELSWIKNLALGTFYLILFLVDKEEIDTTVTQDVGGRASDMEVVEEPGKEEEPHVEEEASNYNLVHNILNISRPFF